MDMLSLVMNVLLPIAGVALAVIGTRMLSAVLLAALGYSSTIAWASSPPKLSRRWLIAWVLLAIVVTGGLCWAQVSDKYEFIPTAVAIFSDVHGIVFGCVGILFTSE